MTTEERILEAAEAEFLDKGFAGARTTAIAEAAGVTHTMLHYYYRTKEKLFDRVVADKLSALAQTFLITVSDDAALTESLRAAVENHFAFVRQNPLLPHFLVCEVFSNPELLALMHKKLESIAGKAIKCLQEKIDEGTKRGECRCVSARSLVLDIVSLNVFPILALPMIKGVMHIVDEDEFLSRRCEENVKTILSKL